MIRLRGRAGIVFFVVAMLSTGLALAKDKPKKNNPDLGRVQALFETTAGTGVENPVCPIVWGDSNSVVDILSTRVDHAVNVRISIGEPVKDRNQNLIKTYWTVRVTDPVIAGVSRSDGGASSEVTVAIEAGAKESERFFLKGSKLGQTTLRWKRQPDASDPSKTFPEGSGPVNVWEFEKIVDYNDLGNENVCYDDQNSPNLHPDPLRRSRCGVEVSKVAADGESRLLLRVKSGLRGKVCFKTVPPTASFPPITDVGQFDGPNPEQTSSDPDSVLRDPYWTFGTYLPPKSFEATGKKLREVEVEIAFTPTNPDGSFVRTNTTVLRKKITIKRPPVLLVHGVWSNNKTWHKTYKSPNLFEEWLIRPMDYKPTNASSFSLNVENVRAETFKLLEASRKDDVVTTQVDIVAHSMGGILSRLTFGPDLHFRRPDNFQKGDARRLITLTSPYWGSQLANMLINLHNAFPHGGENDPVAELERKMGDFHHGAVCDLAENSPGLAIPAASNIYSFAFTGSGGATGNLTQPLRTLALLNFSNFERATHIAPYIFQEANDGIVAVNSQNHQSAVRSENYGNLVHSSPLGITSPPVTGASNIALLVFSKLDRPVSTSNPFSSDIPPVTSSLNGVPRTGIGRGATIDSANYQAQCVQPGPNGLPPMRQ
jgi:pimeloyl-ACP methyl ester carboxylesterase